MKAEGWSFGLACSAGAEVDSEPSLHGYRKEALLPDSLTPNLHGPLMKVVRKNREGQAPSR